MGGPMGVRKAGLDKELGLEHDDKLAFNHFHIILSYLNTRHRVPWTLAR